MKNINTIIFNPDEKKVLLHSLFEDNEIMQGVMKGIIDDFEKADLNKSIKLENERASILTLVLEDKEKFLPQLAGFYENYYGLQKDTPEKRKLEAGIFYTICKILVVRCNYKKGLNKLMYAATFPYMPPKFISLYLFRLGSIYIEQGKIQEASDALTLATNRCQSCADDPIMAKLELLILYQSLRVNIIQGNLIDAKWFIDNITRKLNGKENIIFSSLCGSYHRWSGELNEGYKILSKAYRKYKDNEGTKQTYARSWFNVMYQLACCILEMKKTDSHDKAGELIEKAYSITKDFNYRNLGYCEISLGRIAMEEDHLKKALEHFQKAYNLFDKYTDYRNMARSKRNMGSVWVRMKNYPKAIQNFNQSLDYDNHTQLELGVVQTLLQKIDLRIELIQYYKARDYLNRIQKIKLPLNHFLLEEIKKRKDFLDNIDSAEGIIGESKSIREIINNLESYSKITEPLLITGEGGTGKSFIAEEIHKQSKRKGEFKVLNCQLIPPSNLENEISGLLEKAGHGTVLVEDVCKLPIHIQIKLTRFIDEKRVHIFDGGQEKELDIKLIFAGQNNIEGKIAAGEFSRDFYDRISDFIIKVPPLRERREDIRKLAEYFYVTECKNLNKKIYGIETCAMNLLEDYPWPDNIRELQKTIRRCIVKLKNGHPILREHVLISLDNYIQPLIIEEKGFGVPQGDIINKEIITRLQSLEEKLQKDQEEPSRTRISDSHRIINDVFKIIQERGPVRKSDVTSRCPDAEKSFHHWINILKDKHEVITVEDSANFKVYSVVSQGILCEKLNAGELLKTDNIFSVVED